jgi:8-oxo-dGTP pyrophosphatase MutT (NUDIX family)
VLDHIRQSYLNTSPSKDPVEEVKKKLPQPIVQQYIEKTRLKHAAVMIGITQSEENELRVLLTKRTSHLKHHAGEISLPGGSFDHDQDQDITMTALREAEEEIGLGREESELIGYVSPQVSLGTGFIVTPIVSLIPKDFHPTLNKNEVEEIFEVPISFLLDRNSLQNERRIYDQIEWTVYSYNYLDYMIWGLTAQILRKFSGIIDFDDEKTT